MDIIIQKMNLDDLDIISDILISDFDNFWNPCTLKEELSCDNSYYIVAKLDNEIVGFCGIKITLDEADLMNIVTKKCYRNKGIATSLLNEIIKLCANMSLISITLEVNENNISAISLYEKFDFETIGLRKKYYNSDSAIIMKKVLKKNS